VTPSPAPPWHERLDGARTVAEVVAICREFVALLGAADLAQLPPRLRPPQDLDVNAISAYAVDLVRHDLLLGSATPSMVKMLSGFFGNAAETVARIALARGRPEGWDYVARFK
jgi:hypothetical protein